MLFVAICSLLYRERKGKTQAFSYLQIKGTMLWFQWLIFFLDSLTTNSSTAFSTELHWVRVRTVGYIEESEHFLICFSFLI